MKQAILIPVLVLFSTISLFSQEEEKKNLFDNLELHCYGELTYNVFDWETYPDKRNNFDLNRVTFAPEYKFSEKLKLEMEIEFEHGGTGSTMEFDKFEEFGEFEMEIEKGGEVLIEELEISFQPKKWLEIKAGRIHVPFGYLATTDEPLDYMTTTYNNVEETLIPTTWYEFGLAVKTTYKKLSAELALINALDNSAFSSANWIKRGNQMRFETVNADAFALSARIDYKVFEESTIGVSGYFGNSTPNRPKPDITQDAFVNLFDAHIHLLPGDFTINANILYGTVQNADIVSAANRNLSNNLNVKRTPVASVAFGYFAEAGFDILSLFKESTSKLDVFCGYYYYDSMYETTGDVFNNPRWEKTEIRTGLNYVWNDHIALKSDITLRTIGIPEDNKETTFTTAIAFQF
jgi:hypothetical protein